ncbi:MAG: family 20 glycosylhydrolase [Kiritimatiellae bacterium]|nr:family 20 glycosylhydrolase [Kiritimatiellia bacterium]
MKNVLLFLCLMVYSALLAQPAVRSWRGVLIDTSRHFPEIAELRDLLPHLQEARCTVLHLHLVDGPGWRFESKAYPRLTSVGAWRVDKTDQPWNWRGTEFWTPAHAATGAKRYGGFYTAAALKGFAEEAASYGIQVVPEIDVPGHSAALLTAYPELACPTNRDPKGWFLGKDIICISNPKTLALLDTVIGELCEAFPGAPIHIGCDEVPDYVWRDCPGCQDPAAQRRFYEALIQCVRKRGRTVVAWDELRLTGVSVEDVTLTCWHDEVTPRLQDIACPYSFCYLDQATSRARLPQWRLPDVYGVQLNLWTEELPTRESRWAILLPALRQFKRLIEATPPHTITP